MQCIKKGATLRVSPRKENPCPRIVFRYGSQDEGVREYLEWRKRLKDIMRKMKSDREKEEKEAEA